MVHCLKTNHGFPDKLIVHKYPKVIFRRQVKLVNFKSLFKVAFFQLDDVPVVPMEQRYPAIWVRYFSDYSHMGAKGIKSGLKLLKTD